MNRIALKIAAIIASLFLCAGISYSYWTDEVDVFVNAGTGETELWIINASLIYANSSNIVLDNYKNIEYIKVFNLDSEGTKISIEIKNTGTIPIHIDAIEFYDFKLLDGNKNDDKNIDVEIRLFEKGNIVLSKDTDFGKTKGKDSSMEVKAKNTIRLEPGETATVQLVLTFKDNKKDNGKGKDSDKDTKTVSFEFNLEIIYSRFNK